MGDLIEYLSLDGDKGALEIRSQGVWNVVEKGHFRNRLTQDSNIAALHVGFLKSTPQLNKSVVAEKLLWSVWYVNSVKLNVNGHDRGQFAMNSLEI